MPDKMSKKTSMESPLNAQQLPGNPGPSPMGVPTINPPDPLGILPGGGGKKKEKE